MATEPLPDVRAENSPKSYSARELAEMNLPNMPTSPKGWYDLVARDKWEVVLVSGKGRGCKGGVRREFVPPPAIAALIAHSIITMGTDSAIAHTATPAKALFTTDEAHPARLMNDLPRDADDPGFVYIDKYVNVKGAAGAGQLVHEEAIVQVRVDARLLRERVGNNFGNIKIAAVYGDSMEPTMSHGDQVLIDTSCTRFVDDAIYAIQQDGHLRFKRIQLKLDGSIIVKSDNPVNGPESYTAEEAQYFKVIGVVIPFKFGRFKL